MAQKYKPFGVDLDPKGELAERNLPDGDIHAKIKGESVSYDTMIDELEERANNAARGKPVASKKYFSGWTPPKKESK
jgi:acylphosphatase